VRPVAVPNQNNNLNRSPADYWDSYWIILGLIQSELFDIAKQTLQNFLDEIEHIGFIPNGGRIYCAFSVQVH
jgi:neutral trehalase